MPISNSEFFHVVTKSPAIGPGNSCRAKATIFRSDSSERVDSAVATGATREEAEQKLETAISQKLAAIERPSDWGRDPEPPALIASYLALREALYAMHLKAQANPAHAEQAKRDAAALESTWLSDLKARIARLSENQKATLFKATPEQAIAPDDPWNLDALSAKLSLLRLVDDGSESARSAAQDLEALMEAG